MISGNGSIDFGKVSDSFRFVLNQAPLKLLITFVFIHYTINIAAQKKETFYDFFWKPCAVTEARYYSVVEKTDSGWLRKDYYISNESLQMQALFEDEACKIVNGHTYYFHVNGNPSIIGRQLHGKNEGVCLSYHFNGYISDSAEYKNGRVKGVRYRWYDNGSMSDSIAHVNDSVDVQ